MFILLLLFQQAPDFVKLYNFFDDSQIKHISTLVILYYNSNLILCAGNNKNKSRFK